MIEQKTVLILGAGASCEIGFPLGVKLINEVHALVMGSSEGVERTSLGHRPARMANVTLLRCLLVNANERKKDGTDYSEDDIWNFAKDLWQSHQASIDDFLLHRSEYSVIGKICIFFVLSKYEDPDRFEPTSSSGADWHYPGWGWYKHLWQNLLRGTNGDLKRILDNKLTIVTFNYDRSLEYFLMNTIKASCGYKCENLIADFFTRIPIKHVYGQLGLLSFDSKPMPASERGFKTFKPLHLNCLFELYGKRGDYAANEKDLGGGGLSREERQDFARRILGIAKEIKTYNEAVYDANYRQIFNHELSRIYFLGCGYHDQNLRVIGLGANTLGNNTAIYGTGVGLTNHEAQQKRSILNSINMSDCVIENNLGDDEHGSKITTFLRGVAPLA